MERQDAPAAQPRQEMTGAEALVRALEEVGATDIFGMPGGAILPFYDPLFASKKIRHILVRHEQGAGHAAEGYAMVTGRPGVCVATSGPGATNLVTALADAHMDSVPVVAITGQVGSASIGTDAFQEADIVGATMPMVKHSFLVTRPEDVAARVAEAFHIASTGRPGPVLIDVTKDAQVGMTEFTWPPAMELPGYHPPGRPHQRRVRQAAEVIASARRPVFYLGGGLARAGVTGDLRDLVELVGAPFTTTLTALGVLPASHPLNMGMPGMHGTVAAVGALQRADVVITLGARFDDRVTGKLSTFAPGATVVHADVDPAEISKNRVADVPIVGDLVDIVPALAKALRRVIDEDGRTDISAWISEVDKIRETYPVGWTDDEADHLPAPQAVISRLGELAPSDTVWVTGVGQHQMWAAQFLPHEHTRSWLTSAGAGTMGYGVPAAMGAKVASPDRPVWLIDGDGCFQMTNQELATCTVNDIPIKVAIINNSSLGMVRQWQTLFYGERYSNTDLHTGEGTVRVPDFVRLAEAYGALGLRCERPEDVDAVIEQANAVNDRPVVIDFTVSADAQVWPMVAAGVSNDEIQHARGMSPAWEEE